jgi:hypothetical protein
LNMFHCHAETINRVFHEDHDDAKSTTDFCWLRVRRVVVSSCEP